ncbi:MAG: hypothetical protein ACLGHL_10075, partial [Actinomycetota bacterium]
MEAFRWFAFVLGLGLVLTTTSSIVRTLIVPRGLSSRSVQLVSRFFRKLFLFLANRTDDYYTKDRILVLHGPTLLIGVLVVWLTLYLFGYGLMLWPVVEGGFEEAMRESGSSMLTLGYAGSESAAATALHFAAAATGLIT